MTPVRRPVVFSAKASASPGGYLIRHGRGAAERSRCGLPRRHRRLCPGRARFVHWQKCVVDHESIVGCFDDLDYRCGSRCRVGAEGDVVNSRRRCSTSHRWKHVGCEWRDSVRRRARPRMWRRHRPNRPGGSLKTGTANSGGESGSIIFRQDGHDRCSVKCARWLPPVSPIADWPSILTHPTCSRLGRTMKI